MEDYENMTGMERVSKAIFFHCLILLNARTKGHQMKLVKNHICKKEESRTNEEREVAFSAMCSCAVELTAMGGHGHQLMPSREGWRGVGKLNPLNLANYTCGETSSSERPKVQDSWRLKACLPRCYILSFGL